MNHLQKKDDTVEFIESIIRAEKESATYDPGNVFTYTQHPIDESDIIIDMHLHNYFNQEKINGCSNIRFKNSLLSDGYCSVLTDLHSKTRETMRDKVLKFSKPSGCVKIADRMLDSVLPSSIINRYRIPEKKNFDVSDVMHFQDKNFLTQALF